MKRELKYERQLAHPPERVWRALTEAELMGRWMMETDFELVVGHRFTFRTDPAPTFDGVLYGEVLEVDPPRLLVFSFKGGMMGYVTTVRWTLLPQENGTLLRLEHSGWTGLRDVAISFIIGTGWQRMLDSLPEVLKAMDR